MICRNCGSETGNSNFCQSCGLPIEKEVVTQNTTDTLQFVSIQKKSSMGWMWLGIFFPLIGLILFFVFRKKHIEISKKLLPSVIVGFSLQLMSFVFYLVK
jgi:uncharacterized membrane protein YvbJ